MARQFLGCVLTAAVLVLGVTLRAQAPAAGEFEVVSVKENTGSDLTIRYSPDAPDGFRRINLPLFYYITYALDVSQNFRLVGTPGWATSARFDIVAKAAHAISESDRRAMVRAVLATRFGLRTHVESREQTVLVMTAASPDKRLGPGLTRRLDCDDTSCGPGSAGTGRPDGIELRGATLTQLADGLLSNLRGQVVRDETGIAGVFDVRLSWRPDSAVTDIADPRPSFLTAIQEQLGLKLEPQRRPVDVIVIDHLERPSPD